MQMLLPANYQPPTPIAQVLARLETVPVWDTRARFETSVHVVDATLKVTFATAVSLLSDENSRQANQVLFDIVRQESMGGWVNPLRSLATRLARLRAPAARGWAEWLTSRESNGNKLETWSRLTSIIELVNDPDYDATSKRPSMIDVFNVVVFVRNRTTGHGAKTGAFYDAASVQMTEVASLIAASLPVDFGRWFGSLGVTPDGGSTSLLALDGQTPSQVAEGDRGETARGQLVYGKVGERLIPILPLVDFLPDTVDFRFLNGALNRTTLVAPYVNYRTGEVASLNRPQLAALAQSRPQSATAGGNLEYGRSCAHNVPRLEDGYVQRLELEGRLGKLLRDKTHRIITLRGPGGTGKTSLALSSLQPLVHEATFEYVLWFSARDVDLLTSGPVPRERQVVDLESLARRFCSLLELDASDASPLQLMAATVSQGTVPFLLVLDNFETLDGPQEVQRFLDEYVVPPSKVLITSRHTVFPGDFPLAVGRMTDAEADALLLAEARRHHCEPKMTVDARNRIKVASGASPYAMKLAVSHLARGAAPSAAVSRALDQEGVLEALFDRSFELLDDEARTVTFALAQVGREIPSVLIDAVAPEPDATKGVSEELIAASLANAIDDPPWQAIALVDVASVYARRRLAGAPEELRVGELSAQLRQWYPTSGADPADVAERIARDLRSPRPEKRELSARLLERVASVTPEAWKVYAVSAAAGGLEPSEVRRAFRHAAEHFPLDGTLWRSWAHFELGQGEEEQSVLKFIRAAECPGETPQFVSDVANRVNIFITRNKNRIWHEDRALLVSSLTQRLEAYRGMGELNASDLSRLGWLYLNQHSTLYNPNAQLLANARMCAEEGLALDPQNAHCKNLLDRVKEG